MFRVQRAYRAVLYLTPTDSGNALQTLDVQMHHSLFPEPNGAIGYPYIGPGTYDAQTRLVSFQVEWNTKFSFTGSASADLRRITGTLSHDTFNIVNPVTFEADE